MRPNYREALLFRLTIDLSSPGSMWNVLHFEPAIRQLCARSLIAGTVTQLLFQFVGRRWRESVFSLRRIEIDMDLYVAAFVARPFSCPTVIAHIRQAVFVIAKPSAQECEHQKGTTISIALLTMSAAEPSSTCFLPIRSNRQPASRAFCDFRMSASNAARIR